MPLISVRDTQIHFEERGSGPALLLIHGMGSSGADWAFQVPHFAHSYRVITPDLRGSGLSARPPGPYRIADFAADLWALLDALGIERTHLLGFSLGGAVALEMALMRPQAVERLVKINSLPSYRVDHWRKWLEVYGQIAAVRLLGLPRTARGISQRLFPHPHQQAMRDRVASVVGANSQESYLATVRSLVGWCALDRLPQLISPTLMLAAEYDYTPLQEKREYARRIGARFAVVRDSRHGTPFDAVAATNACVLAFLRDEELPDASVLRVDPPEFAPQQVPA